MGSASPGDPPAASEGAGTGPHGAGPGDAGPEGWPGVEDLVRPGLAVLFCGINPGVRSGQLGRHFARPGNRFWKVLHGAGFTDRLLTAAEQEQLLDYGIGITNLVARTSRAASDLTAAELQAGARRLERDVTGWAPRFVAVLGVSAYRRAFARPRAVIGRQPETIGAGAGLWVLPNPSGLQARYQLAEMVALYSDLQRAAFPPGRDGGRRG